MTEGKAGYGEMTWYSPSVHGTPQVGMPVTDNGLEIGKVTGVVKNGVGWDVTIRCGAEALKDIMCECYSVTGGGISVSREPPK